MIVGGNGPRFVSGYAFKAYRKSLKLCPALAAEAAFNRRETTFSAASSGIPQVAENASGFSR